MYRRIVVCVASITVFATSLVSAQGFLGMRPYSTLVGYEPGSIITTDAKTHSPRVFLPRQGILRMLSDQTPLDLTEPTPIPPQGLEKNVTNDVKVALGAKADSTKDPVLKLGASKIKTAKISIAEGSVRSLVNGDLALEEILRVLTCTNLTNLYSAAQASRSVELVTEVSTIERGKMSVAVKADAGAAFNVLAKVFGTVGSVDHKVDSSLVVTYDRAQPVGYHSRPIDKKRIRDARDRTCAALVVGGLVEWTTTGDGKDYNSTAFFDWIDGSGNRIGLVNGCCSTFPLPTGSTHFETIPQPMNQLNMPQSKLDHGKIIIWHTAVGQDDWDYTVTLWALLSTGQRIRISTNCSATDMHPNSCTW